MLGVTIPHYGGIGVVNRRRKYYPHFNPCPYKGLTSVAVKFDGITSILHRAPFPAFPTVGTPSNTSGFSPSGCGFINDSGVVGFFPPVPEYTALAYGGTPHDCYGYGMFTYLSAYFDSLYYYVAAFNWQDPGLAPVDGLKSSAIYRKSRSGSPLDYLGTYSVIGAPAGYFADPTGTSYVAQPEHQCCVGPIIDFFGNRNPCTAVSLGDNFNYPVTVVVS